MNEAAIDNADQEAKTSLKLSTTPKEDKASIDCYEERAIKSALFKGISDSDIGFALKRRNELLNDRTDLQQKDFSITLGGHLIFHNNL